MKDKDTVSPKPDDRYASIKGEPGPFDAAAEAYGESFETGEWFEAIRIGAFKAGANHVQSRISDLEDELQFQAVHAQDEISKLESRLRSANDKITALEYCLKAAKETLENYRRYCERNNLQGL